MTADLPVPDEAPSRLPVLMVDFNEIDDDLLASFSDATAGTRVHLLDGDGNTCRGVVQRRVSTLALSRPDWDTWWPNAADVIYDDGRVRVRAKWHADPALRARAVELGGGNDTTDTEEKHRE